MEIGANKSLVSLGLVGDGDEIAAISEVERCFGVQLDYSDAKNWRTVGDVFAALRRALPAEQVEARDTWTQFAEALSRETGADPSRVTAETLLLGQNRLGARYPLIIAGLIGLTVAIVRQW